MFQEDSEELIALDSGKVMNRDVVDTIRNIESLGREQYETFMREIIISQERPWNATIHNMNLALMGSNLKPAKRKTDISTVKQDRAQFLQMLISAQAGREIDEQTFAYENNQFPPSLARKGEMYFGTKSDLLQCLLSDIEINTDPEWWPDVDGLALDGFVVLRLVTPGAGDTFQHYAVSFINYIDRNCNKFDRVDMVWDVRQEHSVKLVRGSRGTGIRTKVRATSKVPTNWQGFLRVTSNQ